MKKAVQIYCLQLKNCLKVLFESNKKLATQIKKWVLRFELSNCKSLKCNIDAGLFSAT